MLFPNVKPCPFCGGKDLTIRTDYIIETGGAYKHIMCLECEAHGPTVHVEGNLPSDYEVIQFHWDNRT